MKSFNKTLKENNINLLRKSVSTLQVNMGKLCNQACKHCHVEAGPKRTEMMDMNIISQILRLLKKTRSIKVIDITGGAPELNSNFKYFVRQLRKMQLHVIDRCNLTVLHEKGQEETADFLAKNHVEIIASLPCYTEQNVEKQRGKGVFVKSIKSLRSLNSLGYGKGNKNLKLNLVYNPLGAFLPPNQKNLESEYKKFLKSEFKIFFDNLFSLTNMPIKRFSHFLEKNNKLNAYMNLLYSNFNPNAAKSVMCKDLISVSWNGLIYDCDFNQMLEIPIASKFKNIFAINSFNEVTQKIATKDHCFGCTAGSGSSCGGSLI
ncbi:MAG: hypothetical protein CFH34_01591 [Alphaproteobacteria bacterium MarineAlpha9_Bin4]|nr:radical SAM protein [Pelagibacterales bacterium]PPR25083.1 MAG: hypothetical protein CFH34_01591 [Alphaproteobacteria bacterium MarineAlpha9_Bin4]